jgi:CDGSH-type Zn-finger protein
MSKIKVSKDGPYLVSGNVPLIQEKSVNGVEGEPCCWEKVKDFESKEEYSLCRCGKSKAKPYCDGSHKAEGFVGDDHSMKKYDELADEYPGPKSTLCDCGDICSSARFCHPSGSAWTLVEKGDDKSEKILEEEVACCPSGRLTLKDTETGESKERKYDPEISVTLDPPAEVAGPLWVKGRIEIESSSGEALEKRNRVTLCRCGKSGNKPFCDGSHHDVNFQE